MRAAILSIVLLTLTGCDAKAPPVKETKYVVRIAFVRDEPVSEPFKTPKECEPRRNFMQNEVPNLEGYTKLVRCLPIGNVN